MAILSEKIKTALTAIEAAGKALNVVDVDLAEAKEVRAMLDLRRAELAEVEQQIARTKEAAAQADADHARWQALNAKVRAQGNAEADALQAQLRTLEDQVATRRAEHDNILAGIAALHARLKVG